MMKWNLLHRMGQAYRRQRRIIDRPALIVPCSETPVIIEHYFLHRVQSILS